MAERTDRSRDLRVLTRLWPFVRRHLGVLTASAATLPALAGASVLTPYLLRLAIDRHITPAATGQPGALAGLGWLIAAFLGVQVLELGLRFVQIYLMQRAGQWIMHDLRMAAFAHVQRLSMSFFDRNPIGRIMTRVTSDVETLNELMSQGLVTMVRDLVTLVALVVVMAWIDWRLTLASFIVFPALLAILAVLRRRLRDAYDASRSLVAALNSFLQESLSGMAVIQAFCQEDRNRAEFGDLRGRLLDVDLRGVGYSSYLSAAVQAATTVATAAVLAYGGIGVLGGTVTVGILVQFLEYLRRFYQPIEELSDKYDTLQRAAAAAKKIFSLLDVQPDIVDPPRPVALPPLRSEIRFQSVDFGYGAGGASDEAIGAEDGAGRLVLRDLELSVRCGEKVALVGATGAGKSSIVKLLQRLYEPRRGAISVDGVALEHFRLADLRRFFGAVPQDVFLFTDSIAANIGLGHPRVSADDIRRAAAIVEADSFITELPEGYDTRLGERGANLSFGERQLLAFARALAAGPEVLILDEATSSVDSETEARIQRALRRLVADRTAIIIAHRLSTIREVDRIVVLHHGEVREQGTHDELIDRNGIYATLYRLQYERAGATAVEASEG